MKRLSYGPSEFQTFGYSRRWNADVTTPFGQCARLAIVSDVPVVASIRRLLTHGGPVDVLRRVVAFVVDAVQCVRATRAIANVFVESLERVHPTSAHRDASAAVVAILNASRLQASIDHPLPDDVFGSDLTGAGESVRGKHLARIVRPPAPTGLSAAAHQVVGLHVSLDTALTSAWHAKTSSLAYHAADGCPAMLDCSDRYVQGVNYTVGAA